MYKFIGIGLLSLLVMIVIPFSSVNQSDEPSMYGTITVSLKDKSGNILSENQIHNEVVDQGTSFTLNNVFPSSTDSGGSFRGANAICVTDEPGFAVDEGETFTSFNSGSSITSPYFRCVSEISWTVGSNSLSVTAINFTADTAYQNGTTITGIGICGGGGGSPLRVDCETSSIGTAAVLFGVININDVTPGEGDQIDVTYTVNLD